MENRVNTPFKTTFKQFWGLVWWSLVRHKYLLPTFSLVQVLLALAIVYGLTLLMPEITTNMRVYLSSGAVSLGIIAVGCVLAAQIVNTAKVDGIVAYQKTLPVTHTSIIISDMIIWSFVSLPGVIMSCVASFIRFNITLHISPLSITIIILTQMTMILIGFSIAYWLPTNLMALVTQLIMIGGLLFSPITYPASRLPDWIGYIHNFLPFVPTSNLIRATLFHLGSFSYFNLFVIICWAVGAFLLARLSLTKRS